MIKKIVLFVSFQDEYELALDEDRRAKAKEIFDTYLNPEVCTQIIICTLFDSFQ